MNWWKRWKEKHWVKKKFHDPPGQEIGFGWCEVVPPFRERVERIWADVVAHRWVALSIIGAIVAALIAS